MMRSAERRALVILGITAILAAVLSAMLGTEWVGKANDTSFFFNIPPTGPHATWHWIPILEYTIGFWIVYASFEFFYFSADWFSYKTRRRFHVIATIFMGFYFLYIIAFVPLVSLDLLTLKDPIIFTVFFLLTLLSIATLEVEFVTWATGNRYSMVRGIIGWYRKRRFWAKIRKTTARIAGQEQS